MGAVGVSAPHLVRGHHEVAVTVVAALLAGAVLAAGREVVSTARTGRGTERQGFGELMLLSLPLLLIFLLL